MNELKKRIKIILLAGVLLILLAAIPLSSGYKSVPIKIADQIADESLDIYLAFQPDKRVDQYSLQETQEIRAIKEYINQQQITERADISAADVTISYPYMIFSSESDGNHFWSLYSNGFLMTEDTRVYEVNLSWAPIRDRIIAIPEHTTVSKRDVPLMFVVATRSGSWDSACLQAADVISPLEYAANITGVSEAGITISVQAPKEGAIWLKEKQLQVSLNGQWYQVPINSETVIEPEPDNVGIIPVPDLQPGESKEVFVPFDFWGNLSDLPEGQYRIVACGCIYEFSVE